MHAAIWVWNVRTGEMLFRLSCGIKGIGKQTVCTDLFVREFSRE